MRQIRVGWTSNTGRFLEKSQIRVAFFQKKIFCAKLGSEICQNDKIFFSMNSQIISNKSVNLIGVFKYGQYFSVLKLKKTTDYHNFILFKLFYNPYALIRQLFTQKSFIWTYWLNLLYALRSYLAAYAVMEPRNLTEKIIRENVFCRISVRTGSNKQLPMEYSANNFCFVFPRKTFSCLLAKTFFTKGRTSTLRN